MRLAPFIREHSSSIVDEFESFARTMIPPASTMSDAALRNHAEHILVAIADDMDSAQSASQRHTKSRGESVSTSSAHTSAATHGAMRQLAGFELRQVGAEFRALRAVVLRSWGESDIVLDAQAFEEMTRFNEGIDQAVAESLAAYSARMAESREMFLAVLGHDLRSPLGSLAGCLHLLDKFNPVSPQREKAFAIANRSVAHIDSMITDLLEYTRTRLGRGIEVVPVTGDLETLCRDTFDEMTAAYATRTLEFESAGDLTIAFDGARMRQVLTNLIGNAVQHGDPQRPIRLEVCGADDEVLLTVRNHGVPIPEDLLQVIFDPLVQVEKRTTVVNERPATSLGLGLFIAREIVNAHGAHIGVTSSADGGTVFSIRMPRLPVAPGPAVAHAIGG